MRRYPPVFASAATSIESAGRRREETTRAPAFPPRLLPNPSVSSVKSVDPVPANSYAVTGSGAANCVSIFAEALKKSWIDWLKR